MSSLSDRLQAVLDTFVPQVMEYIPAKLLNGEEEGHLYLQGVVKTPFQTVPVLSDPLQKVLERHARMYTRFTDNGGFAVNASVDDAYQYLITYVLNVYATVSKRSLATQRKTSNFVRLTNADTPIVANILVDMCVHMHSPEWATKTKEQKQEYVEKLEVLRRTYGK